MADITRRFVDILKEVWAEKAQTTIPTRPISGMAYRDPDAEFSTGQQFDSLGESSRWNQALYLLSGLIMEVARFGIMPWSSAQPYQKGALCLGPDGNVWQAQKDLPAIPANPVRPGSDPASWKNFSQTLSVFSGATATVAGTSGTVPAPQKSQQDFILRGDGKWKAFPVSATAVLGGVMVNKGGLQVSASGLLSLLLMQGGGLNLNAAGQLYVDFSLVPDDQMRAIVLSMMQQGGGLNVDGKGKLYVDFASMPTDRFESMLKSIRVPIWLSKNLAFYVDASTGADTLDDGRGLSVSKPFKTIRAAVEYIANNYNLGKYIATVYIGAGIYGEDINLPKYNSTTGYIYLRGIDEDRGQVVINGCIYAGTSVGVYYFRSVTVRNRAGESSIGSKNFFAVSARPGAELQLYNLGIDLSSAAPSIGDKYGIVAMGGTITIRDLNEDDIGLSISSGATVIAQALRGTEGGKIFMLADISISGAVGATLALSGLAIFDVQTMTERDNPKFVGSVTGRRYSVNENSIAKTHGRGPDFIPGDSAGLIDTGGQYS